MEQNNTKENTVSLSLKQAKNQTKHINLVIYYLGTFVLYFATMGLFYENAEDVYVESNHFNLFFSNGVNFVLSAMLFITLFEYYLLFKKTPFQWSFVHFDHGYTFEKLFFKLFIPISYFITKYIALVHSTMFEHPNFFFVYELKLVLLSIMISLLLTTFLFISWGTPSDSDSVLFNQVYLLQKEDTTSLDFLQKEEQVKQVEKEKQIENTKSVNNDPLSKELHKINEQLSFIKSFRSSLDIETNHIIEKKLSHLLKNIQILDSLSDNVKSQGEKEILDMISHIEMYLEEIIVQHDQRILREMKKQNTLLHS